MRKKVHAQRDLFGQHGEQLQLDLVESGGQQGGQVLRGERRPGQLAVAGVHGDRHTDGRLQLLAHRQVRRALESVPGRVGQLGGRARQARQRVGLHAHGDRHQHTHVQLLHLARRPVRVRHRSALHRVRDDQVRQRVVCRRSARARQHARARLVHCGRAVGRDQLAATRRLRRRH